MSKNSIQAAFIKGPMYIKHYGKDCRLYKGP